MTNTLFDLVQSNSLAGGFYTTKKIDNNTQTEREKGTEVQIVQINTSTLQIGNCVYRVCFVKNITS